MSHEITIIDEEILKSEVGKYMTSEQIYIPFSISLNFSLKISKNVYYDNEHNIINSLDKHLYDKNKLEEINISNFKDGETTVGTVEYNYTKLIYMYIKKRQHFDAEIKLRMEEIKKQTSDCKEIIDTCDTVLHNIKDIIKPYITRKCTIDDIIFGKKKITIINEFVRHVMYLENKINIKKKDKHLDVVNVNSEKLESSTLLKIIIRENDKYLQHVLEILIQNNDENKEIYEYMLNNIFVKKINIVDDIPEVIIVLICYNYLLVLIKNNVDGYLNFLNVVENNLRENPYLVVDNKIGFTKALDRRIKVLNDDEIKIKSWAHDNLRIFFDKIFLINDYSFCSFIHDPKNPDLIQGFGFILARSKDTKSWNVFLSDDQEINYLDIDIQVIDERKKYFATTGKPID